MKLCGEISSRGEATDGDGVRIDLQVVKDIALCASGAGATFINGLLSMDMIIGKGKFLKQDKLFQAMTVLQSKLREPKDSQSQT